MSNILIIAIIALILTSVYLIIRYIEILKLIIEVLNEIYQAYPTSFCVFISGGISLIVCILALIYDLPFK